ncbi:MAG: galactose-1-phosphate uridylyltransferase, partial [Bacillota bacterium]|nr:galactose-1-phosphate uridylyltransferase [Bacillota bacterium]
MSRVCPEREIERLLSFAERNNLAEGLDIIIVRNALLDLFNISEPYVGEVPVEGLQTPAEMLDKLWDYAVSSGLVQGDTDLFKDLFSARVMGLLMPRQSEVIDHFSKTYDKKGAMEA